MSALRFSAAAPRVLHHTGKLSYRVIAMCEIRDPDTKWLCRVGGIAGLALGIGYIAIIGVYIAIGAPPMNVDERLVYLASHTAAWWWILALSVLTDLLFVPLTLALYATLKGVSRSMMSLAVSCVALFVFLDLALTWTNYAALITLGGRYVSAVSPAEKAAIVAIAAVPAIILESRLLFIYNSLTLAMGMLLAGIVMLKSAFGKLPAYLGIAVGALGTIAVGGPLVFKFLGSLIVLVSLLTMIWASVVGYRLYMLGRER